MPDKAAVFVSAVLLCAQCYQGNRFIYRSKSGIEWICILIQTNVKRPTCGRTICSCFMLTSTWSVLGIVLKTTCFNVSESTLSLITLYTVHFQISNFAGCFHSLRAVLYTAWKVIFRNPSIHKELKSQSSFTLCDLQTHQNWEVWWLWDIRIPPAWVWDYGNEPQSPRACRKSQPSPRHILLHSCKEVDQHCIHARRLFVPFTMICALK